MSKKKSSFDVTFWGVRGSIPTPEKIYLKYGGNTSCIEVRCGKSILIFDAGSGMKNLGASLAKEFGNKPAEVSMLISHTHWDHIQGFPFFSFIYMKEKKINVYGGHCYSDIRTLLGKQMDREFFPVTLDELFAQFKFSDLNDNPILIDDIKIYHTHLLHPALSVGYRVEYNNRIFVYLTDNELIDEDDLPGYNIRNVGSLIKNADVLVAEAQYTENEYLSKVGWGHSTAEKVVDISIQFGVKSVYIFHHDPYHSDDVIDEIVESGKKRAGKKLKVFGAKEGLTISL